MSCRGGVGWGGCHVRVGWVGPCRGGVGQV